LAEQFKILIHTREDFLRRVRSVFLALEASNEVVEKLPGVTLDEVVQGRVLARGQAGHVRAVAFVHALVTLGRWIQMVGLGAHGLTFTAKLTLPLPRGPS